VLLHHQVLARLGNWLPAPGGVQLFQAVAGSPVHLSKGALQVLGSV
jgi:hypothetical protein